MAGLGWLTCTLADVPGHDRWLGERECEVLAALRVPKRRGDWRLGRWAAKAALAEWTGMPRSRIEILAGDDGAPEAYAAGSPLPVSFSLSHRAGRAVVAVGDGGWMVGCDLEAVEERSHAFMRQWLRPDERELVAGADRRDLAANLLWTAKEAASKARHEGLRLDVRGARVEVGGLGRPAAAWDRLRVEWGDGAVAAGWWRSEPGWVMAVVGDPPFEGPPRELGR